MYNFNGSACANTCRNPHAADNCDLPNTETCECPQGQVFHNGQCIQANRCPCFDEQGNEYPVSGIPTQCFYISTC